MSILTIEFWLMVILTSLACFFIRDIRAKRLILLAVSALIYLTWGVIPFVILAGYAFFSYLLARAVKSNEVGSGDNHGRKALLVIHLVCSLAILFYFKYFGFFVSNLEKITHVSWNTANIILPTGLSFYILTSIGYVIDVYRGRYEAEKDFVKTALLLAYFPKVICGPIERGGAFFEKLDNIRRITKKEVFEEIQIIIWGMIKKYVIADRLGVSVDIVFAHVGRFDALSLFTAAIAYSVQIFCDFSGYTDIAIGISKLMGIDLVRNFDLPYCSKNPSEFWRRWHISLSEWFRDYVYIPLGGSRCSTLRQFLNIMITMLLSGLWHGANWTFILWGALHGGAQCVQKLMTGRKINDRETGARHGLTDGKGTSESLTLLKMFFTFFLMTFFWIFFRAGSIGEAFTFISRMMTLKGGIHYIYSYTPIYALIVLVTGYVFYKRGAGHFRYPVPDLNKKLQLAFFTAEILLLLALAYFGDTSFIYNKF